jgi:Flp pilus assembly pilin Flp
MKISTRLLDLVHSDEGATAVEYAVMLALIISVCFLIIQSIGVRLLPGFETVSNNLP